MIGVNVKVEGLREALDRLNGLNNVLTDGSLMEMSLRVALENTQRRFLDKVDPQNVPWPVSQAGAAREYKGHPFGTLYDTGMLYRSLGAEQIDEFTGVVYQDDDMAPYGIDLTDRWEFLGASDEDMVEITGLALDMLLQGWGS